MQGGSSDSIISANKYRKTISIKDIVNRLLILEGKSDNGRRVVKAIKEDKMNLKEIIGVMIKLGFTAFGGPAAHIAMLEEEVVERRRWTTKEHFMDLVGITNVIPGPNSTQMAMHLSLERGGIAGLLLGTLCFVGPAVLLTILLAVSYYTLGELPYLEHFFYGIKPVAIAIITMAVYKLGQKSTKNKFCLGISICAFLLSFTPMREVYIILAFGLGGLLYSLGAGNRNKLYSVAVIPAVIAERNLRDILFSFLKIGSTLFGSGYLLVAYLNQEFVERLGWLSYEEILEAIAMGQFTPGPVLTGATFVGYQIMGIRGALVATLGIFLPSVFFVYLLNKQMDRVRRNKHTKSALLMLNSAAVGVMAATAMEFLLAFKGDVKGIILVGAGFYLHIYRNVSAINIILTGMFLGAVLSYLI